MNDFHQLKYNQAMKDVHDRGIHDKSSIHRMMIPIHHMSGGLLRENFDYAQKILKARADELANMNTKSVTDYGMEDKYSSKPTTTGPSGNEDLSSLDSLFLKSIEDVKANNLASQFLETLYRIITLIGKSGHFLTRSSVEEYQKISEKVRRLLIAKVDSEQKIFYSQLGANRNDPIQRKRALNQSDKMQKYVAVSEISKTVLQQIYEILSELLLNYHEDITARKLALQAILKKFRTDKVVKELQELGELITATEAGNVSESESDSGSDGDGGPAHGPDSGSDSDGSGSGYGGPRHGPIDLDADIESLASSGVYSTGSQRGSRKWYHDTAPFRDPSESEYGADSDGDSYSDSGSLSDYGDVRPSPQQRDTYSSMFSRSPPFNYGHADVTRRRDLEATRARELYDVKGEQSDGGESAETSYSGFFQSNHIPVIHTGTEDIEPSRYISVATIPGFQSTTIVSAHNPSKEVQEGSKSRQASSLQPLSHLQAEADEAESDEEEEAEDDVAKVSLNNTAPVEHEDTKVERVDVHVAPVARQPQPDQVQRDYEMALEAQAFLDRHQFGKPVIAERTPEVEKDMRAREEAEAFVNPLSSDIHVNTALDKFYRGEELSKTEYKQALKEYNAGLKASVERHNFVILGRMANVQRANERLEDINHLLSKSDPRYVHPYEYKGPKLLEFKKVKEIPPKPDIGPPTSELEVESPTTRPKRKGEEQKVEEVEDVEAPAPARFQERVQELYDDPSSTVKNLIKNYDFTEQDIFNFNYKKKEGDYKKSFGERMNKTDLCHFIVTEGIPRKTPVARDIEKRLDDEVPLSKDTIVSQLQGYTVKTLMDKFPMNEDQIEDFNDNYRTTHKFGPKMNKSEFINFIADEYVRKLKRNEEPTRASLPKGNEKQNIIDTISKWSIPDIKKKYFDKEKIKMYDQRHTVKYASLKNASDKMALIEFVSDHILK